MATIAPDGLAQPTPVVRGWPLIGIAPTLVREGPDAIVRLAKRHGTPLQVPMGRGGSILVAEPDHVRHVLVERARDYPRGRAIDMIRPLLGNGLPMADGEPWLRQRRLMQSAFGRPRLERLVPTIAAVAERHAHRMRVGQTLRAHDLMMPLTRDVIVETMFSDSLGEDTAELDQALAEIEGYVSVFGTLPFDVPLSWPLPANRRFRQAIETVDRVIEEIVAHRREDGPRGDEGDLLDALLEARDPESGEPMPERQLRDEVVNIFYAGHETTANALTWTIALLSAHPEVAERIRDEIRDVLGERTPSAADLERLTWTADVFREAIRLYPPAWIFARTAARDDVIGGRRIPADTVILISPYVTHRLEAHWPDPDRFDPDRFARDETIGLGGGRTAYFPFGAGGHQCIGNHLAMAEAVIALVAVLRRFDLRVLEADRVKARLGATLGVSGGLPVVVGAAR